MTPSVDAVDPRVVRTREVVEAAAAELLAEQGFERVTIEAIAERSGVARSTIYRNWPSRAELLLSGFDRVCSLDAVPDLGSLEDELQALGRTLAQGLTSDEWGQVLPSLVGAAAHDPELVAAQQAFSEQRRSQASVPFDRAQQRGDIDPDAVPEDLAEHFASGFFFRRLMSQQPLDQAFIDRQVAAVLRIAASR